MKTDRAILFLIHSLSYGGAEKILTFVANGLSNKGYTIYVYTYDAAEHYYQLGQNVNHIAETKICKVRGIRRFVQVFQVSDVIKNVKPDVVISFLNFPNLLSILATFFSRTPVIICERGDPYQGDGWFDKLRKFMYKFADGAVFQTDGARDYFCKKVGAKSTIIPNPVTLESNFLSNLEKRNEIAFVARFELKQKRHDLMILAFRKVVDVYPEIKLVFYGDGPDESKVRNLIKQWSLSDNVIFAGLVNDVYEEIRASRMFVLTSDYEGIPNVLIEAMSVGLPVVATNCSPGGARMLIDHQINGLLVPKGDIEAIANAIIFIIENEEIANKYGEKAMEITKRFEPERILDMWEEYINKIIGERK